MMQRIIISFIVCVLSLVIAFNLLNITRWRISKLLAGSYLFNISLIKDALDKSNGDDKEVKISNAGWRCGSIRSHLLLAAAKPSEYSNFRSGPQVRISSTDRVDRENFLSKLYMAAEGNHRLLYGFFHPYCNAGGGGEKVLWKAVETTLKASKDNIALIYSGDVDASPNDILANVASRFGYDLDTDRVVFIYLSHRKYISSKTWPKFTLIGQALGSIVLAIEALVACRPHVWCDTMGYPFAYPFVYWLSGVPIVSYTHYPVISSDMLEKLQNMPGFRTNIRIIGKYIYWQLFMSCYRSVGNYVNISITNSTWTYQHIKSIWTENKTTCIIYPPCFNEKLTSFEDSGTWKRKNQAIVLAQFRPEKRHELVLRSFAQFIAESPSKSDMKLILIGSTRGLEDKRYIKHLQQLAFSQLKIPKDRVHFEIDCDYSTMMRHLHESTFGINAMWNEHFGIAVVEYAAAGLITLANASAGPFLDILVPWDTVNNVQDTELSDDNRTGLFFRDKSDPDYHKTSASSYPSLTELFLQADGLSEGERIGISQRSRMCVVNKFSDSKFSEGWLNVLTKINKLLYLVYKNDNNLQGNRPTNTFDSPGGL